jgi:hypothetical protein
MLADVGTADRRTRPASDRRPDTAHRLPRSQIDAGIRANSSETAGAARAYTTDCGLLKQPDKQGLSSHLVIWLLIDQLGNQMTR